jgi:hypothetical protein
MSKYLDLIQKADIERTASVIAKRKQPVLSFDQKKTSSPNGGKILGAILNMRTFEFPGTLSRTI